jgi:uncharacterized protein
VADTDHPNVARVAEALDAYAAGDWDTMRQHLDDGIAWHVGGDHPLAGTYHGAEAVIGYFKKAQELTGGTLRLHLDEILANDDFAGVVVQVTGERDGKRIDVQMAEAIRFGPDGRWNEFWAIPDEQPSVDEFWR